MQMRETALEEAGRYARCQGAEPSPRIVGYSGQRDAPLILAAHLLTSRMLYVVCCWDDCRKESASGPCPTSRSNCAPAASDFDNAAIPGIDCGGDFLLFEFVVTGDLAFEHVALCNRWRGPPACSAGRVDDHC
jgi:hypothetical protein